MLKSKKPSKASHSWIHISDEMGSAWRRWAATTWSPGSDSCSPQCGHLSSLTLSCPSRHPLRVFGLLAIPHAVSVLHSSPVQIHCPAPHLPFFSVWEVGFVLYLRYNQQKKKKKIMELTTYTFVYFQLNLLLSTSKIRQLFPLSYYWFWCTFFFPNRPGYLLSQTAIITLHILSLFFTFWNIEGSVQTSF